MQYHLQLKSFFHLPRRLLKQIDELHKRAGELLKDGEEEKSYILHYKYWMAVNLIKKSPLYREDPKYVNSMMGGKEKLETNMQFFAQLTKNLQSRYYSHHGPIIAISV